MSPEEKEMPLDMRLEYFISFHIILQLVYGESEDVSNQDKLN